MKALAGPSLVILGSPSCGLPLIREHWAMPRRTASFAPGADCAAPVVKLRHHQPEDINSFLFINLEILFFSAWHVLLSFRWGNAKAQQDCHSLSHCPMAKMLLNILQRTRCPSLPKQTKNDSTPISTLKG